MRNPNGKQTEEATITEVQAEDGNTTDHETVITTADESTQIDKTSSGDNTSFNLDVSDNPFIMSPPPTKSPPIPPTLPPIVVGYNPRKTGRYNLRPNPKPNAHPDFRMLDAIITEENSQTQN